MLNVLLITVPPRDPRNVMIEPLSQPARCVQQSTRSLLYTEISVCSQTSSAPAITKLPHSTAKQFVTRRLRIGAAVDDALTHVVRLPLNVHPSTRMSWRPCAALDEPKT